MRAMNVFLNVVRREVSRMVSRRIYLAACIVLPLFALLFMTTIFGSGEMNGLPVGIVDADNSFTSRSIVRMVGASPTLSVARHYVNEVEAKVDVSRKKIYGYLFIPSDFEEKMTNGNSPVLTYYYHYALLSVGGEVHATFERLLKQVSVAPIVAKAEALGMEEQQTASFLLPVEAQNHALYNPTRNYTVYLSQPFFFVMLQVLILLTTIYALGSERKFGSTAEWMQAADGNVWMAVSGKLLPYSIAFACVSIFANFIFFGVMRLPLPCGWMAINLLTLLFILSTQALALTLFILCPVLEVVISVGSMIGSLGATLSGVTFPIMAMYAPVQWFSLFFPVRHFVEAAQGMLYGGAGWTEQWENVAVLLMFLFPPLLLLPMFKMNRYEE